MGGVGGPAWLWSQVGRGELGREGEGRSLRMDGRVWSSSRQWRRRGQRPADVAEQPVQVLAQVVAGHEVEPQQPSRSQTRTTCIRVVQRERVLRKEVVEEKGRGRVRVLFW